MRTQQAIELHELWTIAIQGITETFGAKGRSTDLLEAIASVPQEVLNHQTVTRAAIDALNRVVDQKDARTGADEFRLAHRLLHSASQDEDNADEPDSSRDW